MSKQSQGVTKDKYQVVPRTLIFITKGREVLLLKGAPDKRLWANLYNGIGGHIEDGEGILFSARRELIEETGLTTGEMMLCGVIHIAVTEKRGVIIFVFRTEYQTGEVSPSNEGVPEWVEIDEINKYPLVEDLFDLIPRVMNWDRSLPPFIAFYNYDADEKLKISFET